MQKRTMIVPDKLSSDTTASVTNKRQAPSDWDGSVPSSSTQHQIFCRGAFSDHVADALSKQAKRRLTGRRKKFIVVSALSSSGLSRHGARSIESGDEMLQRFSDGLAAMGLTYEAGLFSHLRQGATDYWLAALFVDPEISVVTVRTRMEQSRGAFYSICSPKDFNAMFDAVYSVVTAHCHRDFKDVSKQAEKVVAHADQTNASPSLASRAESFNKGDGRQIPKKTAHFEVLGEFGATAERALDADSLADGRFVFIYLISSGLNAARADMMADDIAGSAIDRFSRFLRDAGVEHGPGLICHYVHEYDDGVCLLFWGCILEVPETISAEALKEDISASSDWNLIGLESAETIDFKWVLGLLTPFGDEDFTDIMNMPRH